MKKDNDIKVEILCKSIIKNEVEVGDSVTIIVTIPKKYGIVSNVQVLFNKEGENPSIIKSLNRKEEKESDDYYFETKVIFNEVTRMFFYFKVNVNGQNQAIKINRKTKNPFFTTQESPYWSILIINKNFKVPEWSKGAIYYQIFVDRFFRPNGNFKLVEGRNYRNWGEMPNFHRNAEGKFHNNDFFGGNLKGVEEKLKYLKKLNVTVIYLSPILYSKYRYDRYATTDYEKIDINAGTFEDLKSLHDKANKMGMKLILDVVFDHLGSDNPIFIDAITNKKSKYRDWFFIGNDGKYRYWYNEFTDMPVFNQQNPEYQNYIYGKGGIVEKLTKYVDGFRIDVAEEIENLFLEGLRNKANEQTKHITIAEHWHKADVTELGKCYDTTTNYLYTNAIYKWILYGEGEYFKNQINDIIQSYPEESICSMLNSLDTHDIVRALTIIGGKWMRHDYKEIWKIDEYPSRWHKNVNGKIIFETDEFRKEEAQNDKLKPVEYRIAKEKLKIAALLQYVLPGNPCIYYGTEIGMHGYKDPFNRKCFEWNKIDKTLLRYYIKLGKFRKNNKSQLSNSKTEIYYVDESILYLIRNNLLIIINASNSLKKINVPEEFIKGEKIFEVKKQENLENILPLNGIVLKK